MSFHLRQLGAGPPRWTADWLEPDPSWGNSNDFYPSSIDMYASNATTTISCRRRQDTFVIVVAFIRSFIALVSAVA